MFKKNNRLTRSEFSHYYKIGKKEHNKHLTFITSPSPTPKISVVVGKKVSKIAVRRNTIKRQVYATLRSAPTSDKFEVLIVVVKPSFPSLGKKQAREFLIKEIEGLYKTS